MEIAKYLQNTARIRWRLMDTDDLLSAETVSLKGAVIINY